MQYLPPPNHLMMTRKDMILSLENLMVSLKYRQISFERLDLIAEISWGRSCRKIHNGTIH